MSEENLMILKMVQDGKITPEQAEVLLKAISRHGNGAGPADPGQRAEGSGPSAGPPPPPPPHAPPPPPFGPDVQGRLADLQSKLAELQAKLGAAQSTTGIGKISFPFGLGEINVGQIVDDAMKGINSFKSDLIREAKQAARTAQKEARKVKREARKSGRGFRFEFSFTGDNSERPSNADGKPERSESGERTLSIDPGNVLKVSNPFGNVKVLACSEGETPRVHWTKNAWGDEGVLEDHLSKLSVECDTNESGNVGRIWVNSTGADAHATVDLDIWIPSVTIVDLETTFGEVAVENLSGGTQRVESTSGDIRVLNIHSESGASGAFKSRSGDISINQWQGGPLNTESISGSISIDGVKGTQTVISSRSGSCRIANATIVGDLTLENGSGELELNAVNVTEGIQSRTQSGDVSLGDVHCGRALVDLISGDIVANDLEAAVGTLNLKTVSGDIEASGLKATAYGFNTISGDAEVSIGAPVAGSLGGATVSGDFTLSIWSSSDTNIELSTQSGKLECDLPLERREASGGRFLSGVLGAGTGSIKLQSVSGNLTVKPTG